MDQPVDEVIAKSTYIGRKDHCRPMSYIIAIVVRPAQNCAQFLCSTLKFTVQKQLVWQKYTSSAAAIVSYIAGKRLVANATTHRLSCQVRGHVLEACVSECNSKRTSVVLLTPISVAAQVNHPDSLPKDA
ncbi:unnamed protein product [Clonostachys rhizophaga]|uniref:Uncharacterized protein n=1 Tax=Clonostachys rhizophaga TaxID=160324 RepID=A0A9N9YGC6_9HYPO|nr:unnamed protein product [Clonostachys rhizophaga]